MEIAGSKILCDTNWDVMFEDLPTRNGHTQLLDCKCSWLYFLLSSLYFGKLMVLTDSCLVQSLKHGQSTNDKRL